MAEGERRAMATATATATDDASASVEGRLEIGRPAVLLVCGSLVYYHCAYRGSSLLSLVSDVLLVLLCSLAILGALFRQMNITVPVDPLEWQISQDTANTIVACLANTVGAAESVLRVAATGHDKRLFFKVVLTLYMLSAFGRVASGATIAYAGLCILCLYFFAQSSELISRCTSQFTKRRDSACGVQDAM
ncbi:reticulon-like protein B23 isoform X5 [Canna indica]|uniref:Reticulon-like protein B23 isoform X5 n=1 Tax=Canna indica TaxID=4628 RepID=A0AAQ3QDG7_9LILI|nr:reticulon-like protein B23 isoform X5 [Canna indica]